MQDLGLGTEPGLPVTQPRAAFFVLIHISQGPLKGARPGRRQVSILVGVNPGLDDVVHTTTTTRRITASSSPLLAALTPPHPRTSHPLAFVSHSASRRPTMPNCVHRALATSPTLSHSLPPCRRRPLPPHAALPLRSPSRIGLPSPPR